MKMKKWTLLLCCTFSFLSAIACTSTSGLSGVNIIENILINEEAPVSLDSFYNSSTRKRTVPIWIIIEKASPAKAAELKKEYKRKCLQSAVSQFQFFVEALCVLPTTAILFLPPSGGIEAGRTKKKALAVSVKEALAQYQRVEVNKRRVRSWTV